MREGYEEALGGVVWEEHSQQEVYYEERRADTQEGLVECGALK